MMKVHKIAKVSEDLRPSNPKRFFPVLTVTYLGGIR